MSGTVLWDFDGTLAIRPGLWSQAMVDVLDRHCPGHGRVAEDFRPALRDGFPWHRPDEPHLELTESTAWWESVNDVLRAAFVDAGFGPAADRLTTAVREVLLDAGSWRVYEDAVPALTALTEAGWEHVVVSNHVPELADLVAGLGLAHHFRAIITSGRIGYEKPRPEIFRAALAAADQGPAVMVGDNPIADVQGARDVGLAGFLVRREPDGHRSFPDLSSLARELLGS